jgi:hypothetical protein
MAVTSGNTQGDRVPLPKEISSAISQVPTQTLFDEMSRDDILAPAELMIFRREFTNLLKNVWYDRNYNPAGLLPSSVQPEKRRAALWKMEEMVLSPLTDMLRSAELGNDDVLFQQKDFVLTAARCNGHTTDRVTVKSQTRVLRKHFLRKSTTVTEVVLDVDYPEQGRFGNYETLYLDLATEEDVQRFREALAKASMIGCFNAFLGRMRQMV